MARRLRGGATSSPPGLSGVDLLFVLLITVVFFSLPVFITPDSNSYITNAYVLRGELPLSSWDSVRGPALPVILLITFVLFGESAYGMAVTMYVAYLCFVALTLYNCHLLGITRRLGKGLTWLCCTLLLFCNPSVLTYAHHVLTEFFALVLALLCTAILLKTQQLLQKEGQKRLPVALVRYLGTLVCVVALYALKQMFFVLALVPFLILEVQLLIGRFSARRLGASVLAILVIMLSVPLWSAGWSGLLARNAPVRQDYTAGSLAQSTLVDGLRYFRPEERGTTGVPVRIDVMSQGYTEVLDSFTYTFKGTLADSVRFAATCFIKSPGRFFASYIDNYLVISNVRRLLGYETRSYGPVSITNHFNLSFETEAWLERFKHLEVGTTGYSEEMPSGNPQFEQMTDNGLVANLLFNTPYPAFSYFLYSFPAFCAPFVFALSILMWALRRKTPRKARFWQVCLLLSGCVFIYILFLAVTSANIDRYGFPVSAFSGLLVLWVGLAAAGGLYRLARPPLPALRRQKLAARGAEKTTS